MVEIAGVDPFDEQALRAWFDAEQVAFHAGRPYAYSRTFEALAAAVRDPGEYVRRDLVTARDGDVVVGTGELELSLNDNTHLAEVAVHVVPARRREGIGTALLDRLDALRREAGRTTVIAELFVPDGAVGRAGLEFATRAGFGSVHVEDHLVLDLPVAADRLAARRAELDGAGAAYEVVTWGDRCPAELRAGYCRLKTQMADDVPVGELDWEPIVYDESRLRSFEERMVRSYRQVVAAARDADGELVGHSQVFLPHGQPTAIQGDTLVMPALRGHRLGTLLKLATLEVVAREHPDRTVLHTWTDPENHAMHRTNLRFGYRVVEQMHEMQRRD
ncbi:GNAT family N-acetyltransferase [Nocardioides sp. GCM10027113]|uniref:GNAT family N-acetyltransferase n=1 Tax=unclassified Nocardioides TaxID=2615069 RepID=UPI003612916D